MKLQHVEPILLESDGRPVRPILSSPLVRAALELRRSVLSFADVDAGAASALNLPRHGDRADASSSGGTAPTQGMVDGFDRGGTAVAHRTDPDDRHLLRIGFHPSPSERDRDA
jgi:hypothetical protein